MGVSQLVACVCLTVLIVVVSAQNEIRRPVVQAPPVLDSEMNTIVAECNRRIGINDTISHYVRVPSFCGAYAVCEHPETGVVPTMMLCPAGMFFNDDMDVVTCVKPFQANCPPNADPCSGRPDGFNQDVIRTQTIQGAYYECRSGRAVGGGWCELGQQYLKFDQACFNIPDLPPQTPPPRNPIPCHLQALEGGSGFLLGGLPMACPGNTQFNQAACGCI